MASAAAIPNIGQTDLPLKDTVSFPSSSGTVMISSDRVNRTESITSGGATCSAVRVKRKLKPQNTLPIAAAATGSIALFLSIPPPPFCIVSVTHCIDRRKISQYADFHCAAAFCRL